MAIVPPDVGAWGRAVFGPEWDDPDWHPVVHGEPVEDWGHDDCAVCDVARARDARASAE